LIEFRHKSGRFGRSFSSAGAMYGRGAILITTNKSVRDWTELLAGDEALAAAILDRLLHKAHVLNIKGRSYRLRDLEATLGTARH
jgi:DNA replication protein DnaC